MAPVWLGPKGPDGDWVRDSLGIKSHCGERQNAKLKDSARTEMVIGKITKKHNVHFLMFKMLQSILISLWKVESTVF